MRKEAPSQDIRPWATETGQEILDPTISSLDWSSATKRNVAGTLEVFSIGAKSGLFPKIRIKEEPSDYMNPRDLNDQDTSTIDLKYGLGDPHREMVVTIFMILSTHIHNEEE